MNGVLIIVSNVSNVFYISPDIHQLIFLSKTNKKGETISNVTWINLTMAV